LWVIRIGGGRQHVDLWARRALHGVNCAAEHAASREDMMSVQPLRKEGDRNPRTAEEAKALLKHVESLFMPWNIDALVGGFTDDCVVRFGTVPARYRHGDARGLEVSPGCLLQNELVQRQVGDRLAKTGILRLELLQALDLLSFQPAVLLPPPIIGDLAHTDLADRVSDILTL
jgi:hypothetical protein